MCNATNTHTHTHAYLLITLCYYTNPSIQDDNPMERHFNINTKWYQRHKKNLTSVDVKMQ